VRIAGITGKLISIGQRFIGSGSRYTHAFVYVGSGMVVQGEPGGAKLTTLTRALNGREVVYSKIFLAEPERTEVIQAALNLVGTPYSFLDYLAIGASRLLHIKALERYVGSTGHMICSQLVDECYSRAGIHLFPYRIPGDITPGDLAHLIGA